MEVINTIGRRKTAVARLYMQSGKGTVTINSKDLKDYFVTDILQAIVNQPFAATKNEGAFDLKINVDGGGIAGQAEAVR